MQCAPGSQLCKLSLGLGWALVMQLYLVHFCSFKEPHSLSNPNKTHGSPSWTLEVAVLWLVMGSSLGWVHVCAAPQKFCHTSVFSSVSES